jgi:hypothetical protein
VSVDESISKTFVGKRSQPQPAAPSARPAAAGAEVSEAQPAAPVAAAAPPALPVDVWAADIPDGSDQRIASRLFIHSVAPVLEHLCDMTSDRGPTSFDGVKPPPIELQQYIQRLYSFIPCSSQCFVYAIVYVDRILRMNPRFKLSDLNVHRTFFTALVVASKFYDDEYYSNSWYGRVGGVCAKELNILEASFLKLIQFRCSVSPEEYEMYLSSVERACSDKGHDVDECVKAPVAEACGAACGADTAVTCATSCAATCDAKSSPSCGVECTVSSSSSSCAAAAA